MTKSEMSSAVLSRCVSAMTTGPVTSLAATTDRVNGASISPGLGPSLGVRIAILSLVSAITTRSEWEIESQVTIQHVDKLKGQNLEISDFPVAHLLQESAQKNLQAPRPVLDQTIPTVNHQEDSLIFDYYYRYIKISSREGEKEKGGEWMATRADAFFAFAAGNEQRQSLHPVGATGE
ncbi:uncharacterized protein BDW47DRAFT_104491 [Aspergillus candidus]|uniref:Uncharacterized protein n=1 Tax=Aspergillus candidus TaxID=41067 RepID=A0A2I2FE35_ASPCN|nr:hypothetical protein BDW47DRAFT_104491 [Aspergillus candidus]PLB38896.1 hypothetical protein BDW47DRAFT_104491 [Aspergillus candidus]